MAYSYKKIVQFYETDCMGVVHHSNYLRFFEEARVAWLKDSGLIKVHAPYSDLTFAVLSSSVEHKAPCRFGDELEVNLEVRIERAKLRFQYAIYTAQDKALVATGQTLHIALDGQHRVCRIPEEVKTLTEREKWTETWP